MIERDKTSFTATCDQCRKSTAWGDVPESEHYPDDEIRRQLHKLGWDDRSSRTRGRITWTWLCPACRPAPVAATGPSLNTGMFMAPRPKPKADDWNQHEPRDPLGDIAAALDPHHCPACGSTMIGNAVGVADGKAQIAFRCPHCPTS
jgi:hypothetical protein